MRFLINGRQVILVQLHVFHLVVDLGTELQFRANGFSRLYGGSLVTFHPGFLFSTDRLCGASLLNTGIFRNRIFLRRSAASRLVSRLSATTPRVNVENIVAICPADRQKRFIFFRCRGNHFIGIAHWFLLSWRERILLKSETVFRLTFFLIAENSAAQAPSSRSMVSY